jgi:hypothetical protein
MFAIAFTDFPRMAKKQAIDHWHVGRRTLPAAKVFLEAMTAYYAAPACVQALDESAERSMPPQRRR